MPKEKREIKKLTTPVFRLSFPNLFEARAASDDANAKPKFGCSAIWTPSKFSEHEKGLWRAILAELDAEARRKFRKPWKELPDNVRRGIRDGASKDNLEGYGEGTRFANLTTKTRPGVAHYKKGDDGKYIKIGPEHDNAELIYPGCFCRATVNVYSYDNKGKGVALGLQNIQFVKDGPRLDSRTNADDDFEDDLESKWLDDDTDNDTSDTSDDDFE